MTSDREADVERRIRAAMEQLLSGHAPDGHKCNVKSLCVLAGVARATFYRTYPHLKADFEQRLGRLRDNGDEPDHRLAQLERLKGDVARLRDQLARAHRVNADHETFRATALSRLTSQHDEITELRRELQAARGSRLRAVPAD